MNIISVQYVLQVHQIAIGVDSVFASLTIPQFIVPRVLRTYIYLINKIILSYKCVLYVPIHFISAAAEYVQCAYYVWMLVR